MGEGRTVAGRGPASASNLAQPACTSVLPLKSKSRSTPPPSARACRMHYDGALPVLHWPELELGAGEMVDDTAAPRSRAVNYLRLRRPRARR